MKIILTEKQLKLIIESESEDKLFTLPVELLNREGGFIKMSNLYFKNKEKKNYNGIKIIGDLNFDHIDDDLDYQEDSINDFLDELIEIDGYLNANKHQSIELPKLKIVNGYVNLMDSGITELPKLKIVNGYVNLMDSGITELPMLSTVGEFLNLRETPIKELPMLSTVGGYLDLRNDFLGEELKKTMSKEEIKNKFGVKGDLYI